MSDVAHYAVRDAIAVITMNNPPVNGLGNALRAALMNYLKNAEADPSVKGAVIIGSAKALRRRRHPRVRQAAREARPLRGERPAGRDVEAARRRDRRLRARRRPRARARLPLPRRAPPRNWACPR